MIPDYQALMRPVLQTAASGEVRIGEVIDQLADTVALSEEDREELLPSGKQTKFANRVHWARSYLKQAGLVRATRRGHFTITDRGREALSETGLEINRAYLERYPEFLEFQSRTREAEGSAGDAPSSDDTTATPDEVLRVAHGKINAALTAELLDRVREASPAFFEHVIIELLLAMGYGGTSEDAGRALGRSGVDGVIDQDPLGVDQGVSNVEFPVVDPDVVPVRNRAAGETFRETLLVAVVADESRHNRPLDRVDNSMRFGRVKP